VSANMRGTHVRNSVEVGSGDSTVKKEFCLFRARQQLTRKKETESRDVMEKGGKKKKNETSARNAGRTEGTSGGKKNKKKEF